MMNEAMDSTLGTAMINALDWPGLTVVLARQASVLALLIVAISLVGLLAAFFLRPTESRGPDLSSTCRTSASRLELETDLCPSGLWLDHYSVDRQVPRVQAWAVASVDGSRWLSPTDLIALTALRRRVKAGQVTEAPPAHERLAFARWLVAQNRLRG